MESTSLPRIAVFLRRERLAGGAAEEVGHVPRRRLAFLLAPLDAYRLRGELRLLVGLRQHGDAVAVTDDLNDARQPFRDRHVRFL